MKAMPFLLIALLLIGCSSPNNTQRQTTLGEIPVQEDSTNSRILIGTANVTDSFVLPLKRGDFVELTIDDVGDDSNFNVVWLKDPYGNEVGHSSFYYRPKNEVRPLDEIGNQKFPWRLDFVATSTGNYLIEVHPRGKYRSFTVKAVVNP